MNEEELSQRRRRILRLIRSLDIRYIRGSVDKRTYNTLKNRYYKMLQELPVQFTDQQTQSEDLLLVDDVESRLQQISEDSVQTEKVVEQPIIELPNIDLKGILPIKIQELKIRYVMQMAIKAATKIFQDEIRAEHEYLQGKYSEKEYLEIRNDIEAKQNRIFNQFYKLSDMLFSITRNFPYRAVHDNFLLFNNELSENINRLREKSISSSELKGIIYEINNRVSKHLPILKKAKEETLKWKIIVQQETEKFKLFYKHNEDKLTEEQKTKVKRIIQELEVYQQLLDEDINDYTTDIMALNEIYGDHLYYQEFGTPFFNNLPRDVEERIKRFTEVMGISQLAPPKLQILDSKETYTIDNELMRELRQVWLLAGRPVVDLQDDLVGFVIGPGKLGEKYGIVIKQQQEISLSMIRRIYDHVVAPTLITPTNKTEEEKRDFLIKEMIRTLPGVPFPFLVPDSIVRYCEIIDAELNEDVRNVLVQPENYLFVPIEYIQKEPRIIKADTAHIVNASNSFLLPFFDPRKKNEIEGVLSRKSNIPVKDLYKRELGKAHSVVFHPNKGYFLLLEQNTLPDVFFARIYNILYPPSEEENEFDTQSVIQKKKWELIFRLAREYNTSEGDIEDTERLKAILVEKNTGILPTYVENAKFKLLPLGNIKIANDELFVTYQTPLFEIDEILDVKGKIIENIQGKELGIVYNLTINEKTALYIWSEINFALIARLVEDDIEQLLKKHKSFLTDLETSIAFKLNIAPQLALRPDIVMTFMNLIGRIKTLEQMETIFKEFKPIELELDRVISIEPRKILVDVVDIKEIARSMEEQEETELEQFFVEAPDYYLQRRSEDER